MSTECNLPGDECYNCDSYRGAYACLPKVKTSELTQSPILELETALEDECGKILLPVSFVPCAGDPVTKSVDLKDIFNQSQGASPMGMTFWTPFDFGDIYMGCWYKFNDDLVISRTDLPDFFEAAGISGDTYTIKGMSGRYARGASTACGYGAERGSHTTTLGCTNLPACPISISDPGHDHSFVFPMNKDASDGSEVRTVHNGASDSPNFPDADERKGWNVGPSATGISASHKTGSGGNGTPVAFSNEPASTCGAWYIKLSNDCN